MIWAYVDSIKEKAATGLTGFCPDCHNSLIPKCGEINVHHWSHWGERNCDPWDEPETPWHIKSKSRFPGDWQEVTIGEHRADVKTPTTVIEFQHSPISPEEIRERETFYGDMVWVVNAVPFRGNLITIADRHYLNSRGDWGGVGNEMRLGNIVCQWKWVRKSWKAAQKPLYLDLGSDRLLFVKKFGRVFSGLSYDLVNAVAGSIVKYQVLINSTVPVTQRKHINLY